LPPQATAGPSLADFTFSTDGASCSVRRLMISKLDNFDA